MNELTCEPPNSIFSEERDALRLVEVLEATLLHGSLSPKVA